LQWIAHATADIGSLINRWWRDVGRELPIFLIISGSEVSFFERQILTGSIYGRRTGQPQLAPFGYKAAGLFFPSWSADDRMRAYAVCGGMPYYLDQFVSRPAFEEACQDYLRVHEQAATVGTWWGQVREGPRWVTRELDGLALDGDGHATAIASAKWTNEQPGTSEESLLARLESEGGPQPPPLLLLPIGLRCQPHGSRCRRAAPGSARHPS